MSEKAILYLDVDGVINACPLDRDNPIAVECEPIFQADSGIGSFPINAPVGTKERIARLADEMEVVWATSWRGAAHPELREQLDLPQESWRYLDWHNLKLPNIIRDAGDRRWAWIDDDAQWELDQMEWERDRHVTGLILVPELNIGLTDEHVDQLLEFARGG